MTSTEQFLASLGKPGPRKAGSEGNRLRCPYNPEQMAVIAKRCQQRRFELRLSLEDTGLRCGLSHYTISVLERGFPVSPQTLATVQARLAPQGQPGWLLEGLPTSEGKVS